MSNMCRPDLLSAYILSGRRNEGWPREKKGETMNTDEDWSGLYTVAGDNESLGSGKALLITRNGIN